MKRFLITAVCLLSAYAYGETTFQIPVFVEGVPTAAKGKQKDKTKTMPVAWLNAKIKKAGLKPIQESVEVSSAKDAEQFTKIGEQIDEASKKLGPAYKGLQLANETTPGQNYAGNVGTCYTGRADGVPGLVKELIDSYYSDQLGIWGWKYHKTVSYDGNDDPKGMEEFLSSNGPKIWKTWRGDDDSVLILTHEGDDGTDIEVGILKRCED